MRILIIEDEKKVAKALREGLEAERYEVSVAATGEEGFFLASEGSFDLLLLDLMLPRRDGIDVLTMLRKCGVQTPVFVLTAKDAVEDRVLGLDRGADDYLTKPFDLGELVARLHALLRRAALSDEHSDAMTVGPLTIDTARRLVFVDGERVDLTKREFDLLAALAENAGVVLSRQRLLELVWGYDFDVDTNVADVFISYLRRKLERDGVPRVIHTVRGIGYVLRADP